MSIHPAALVSSSAHVHPSATIGPFCLVGDGVTIGPGTHLISHVVVDGPATIGADNRLHPHSSLGGPGQHLAHLRDRSGSLVIGDDNEIREHVTINRGTPAGSGVTRIGNGCLLMAGTHLGHDVTLGSHIVIAGGSQLAGHVTADDHVFVAGLVGIAPYVRLGAYCSVSGCAGLSSDVPPYAITASASTPSKVRGVNLRRLRRAGFSDGLLSALTEVFRVLADRSRPYPERRDDALSLGRGASEVRAVIEFIDTSRAGGRGVRFASRGRRAPEPTP
jgi:UDP-N-acetylglucosamine acyltransferase